MSETKILSPLPPVRRVITGHSPEGKSIVVRDDVQPAKFWSADSMNSIYDIYRTEHVPASIDSEVTTGSFVDEIASKPEHVNPTGTICRSFEFSPGSVTPFHRTMSMDYGIVVKGSMVLQLDDDKKITLNEGDIICQRGTIHSWRNESSEWSRIYFVILGAKPVVINGKELGEEWHPPA